MQTVFFEILIRLLGRFYPLPLLLAPLHREPSFVDDGLRVNNTRNIRKNTTKVARFFRQSRQQCLLHNSAGELLRFTAP